MARPLPEIVRIEWPPGHDAPSPATDAALDRAADVLRRGGLVAIPTETVYGLAANALDEAAATGPARSPGSRARHYCPKTALELPADPAARVQAHLAAGRRVGWLVLVADERARALAGSRDLVAVPMPTDPAAYARQLYATLHALDQRQLDRIVADPPPADEAWRAVADRLSRAAEPGANEA